MGQPHVSDKKFNHVASITSTMKSFLALLLVSMCGSTAAFFSTMPSSVVSTRDLTLSAHHVMNKGTKKHVKNRPKKVWGLSKCDVFISTLSLLLLWSYFCLLFAPQHRKSDVNRKPTSYEALPTPPPEWTVIEGSAEEPEAPVL